IDPATLNIDPAEVARRITPQTKAIMPVHYAGQPCDMDELDDLARRHRLLVIEDAAHAVGARYKGQPIGSARERVAVFSFYAIKNLTTGEGGMLVTGRQDLAERARALSDHGLSRDSWKRYTSEGSWRYDVVAPGFNFHMTDIQAALGLHQLQRLEGFLEHRARIARAYDGLLQEHPALAIPEVRQDRRHARHLYPVLVRQERLRVGRDAVIEALRRENVGTSVHFQPVHLFSYYRERFGFQPGDFPQAERAGATEISLPLHTRMSEEDAQRVAEALLRVLDHFRR
ncbi:MAG: DegT/DnrJ/EryC1/StrS family aminotransferase, partial [Chloroflexi bacterium]|nr:DegT/DnrJ/EryC1/StrS family aminotransferase [Chloroflexota bacterium]